MSEGFAGLAVDVGGTKTQIVVVKPTETGHEPETVAEYKTAEYASIGAAFRARALPELGNRWPDEFQFLIIAAAGLPDRDGVTHFCYPGGRLAWDDLRSIVEDAGLLFGYGNDAELQGGIMFHPRVREISVEVQPGRPDSKQLNADTSLLVALGTGSGTAFRVGDRVLTSEGGNRMIPGPIDEHFPELCTGVRDLLRARDPDWHSRKWRAECLFSQSGLSDLAQLVTGEKLPWDELCAIYRENVPLREQAAEILGINVGDWAVMLKPAEILLRCALLRDVNEILTSPESQAAFRRGVERQPTRTELALEVPVRLLTVEDAHLIGMGVVAVKKWRPDLLDQI
jgi:hypothetical protein